MHKSAHIPRRTSRSAKRCWACRWAAWTTNSVSVDRDRRWRNTAAVASDRLSTWPANASGRCARVVQNSVNVGSLEARWRSLELRPRCNGFRHSKVFVPRCNNQKTIINIRHIDIMKSSLQWWHLLAQNLNLVFIVPIEKRQNSTFNWPLICNRHLSRRTK